VAKKMKVIINKNEEVSVFEGITFGELSKMCAEKFSADIVIAKTGNTLKELNDKVPSGTEVQFFDCTNQDGASVYARGASLIMLKAVRDILGTDAQVVIEHSINGNYYCDFRAGLPKITKTLLKSIKNRMDALVKENIEIEKKLMTKDEGIETAIKFDMEDKARLYRYRKASYMNMYDLDGYCNYFYGYMVPSTGSIKKYDLIPYEKGFLLLLPDANNPDEFNRYEGFDKISNVFMEQLKWSELMKVRNVADLNDLVTEEEFKQLVLFNEALHEKKVAQIADNITEKVPLVKVVLIAGPSSSGKTTFAQRLCVQLRVNGIVPHVIGMDDYFINRVNTPLDEFGKPDFESINALDLEQFNKDLLGLINGEQVQIPSYNFISGEREYRGRSIQLQKDEIIVVEGIHSLNDVLTKDVPTENKYRIFISAMTQLNMDDHNRISTSESRLVRRIVRDHQFRGNDARRTIDIWASVRRGEEKNIFPYQENADVMFNSATIYELSVLKAYIEPLLFKIDKTMPEYVIANRIIKFLDYFLPVNSDCVPNNSIIKEFVGGSVFDV